MLSTAPAVFSLPCHAGQTPFAKAVRATISPTATDSSSSVADSSGSSSSPPRSPGDGSDPTGAAVAAVAAVAAASTEASVAAEIEELHKGDDHAKLYGRIAGWGGSRESLFGVGTRGAGVPDQARDVVVAMLRPRPEDRLESGAVLRLPWVSLRGKGSAAAATSS